MVCVDEILIEIFFLIAYHDFTIYHFITTHFWHFVNTFCELNFVIFF